MTVRLEVDVPPSQRSAYAVGYAWIGEGKFDGISIEVSPTQGHGFGLTEVVDATILYGGSIVTGIAGNLLTDAIKLAVRGTVRRSRARRGRVEMPPPEEDEAFDIEAKSLAGSVRDALGGTASSHPSNEDAGNGG